MKQATMHAAMHAQTTHTSQFSAMVLPRGYHDDDIALKTNFAILVGRLLKKHMPFFATYGSGLQSHIKHVYYKEMAQKSKVVSCYMSINCYMCLSL